MGLLAVFKKLGHLIKAAFGFAQSAGLTDALVEDTVALVAEAQRNLSDNAAKREWVVAALRAMGIKESIARLAVELAVQIWKRKQET